MPFRTITLNGTPWRVTLSGCVTANDLDELGLVFTQEAGNGREVRVTRLSPFNVRSGERVLAELSERDLARLWQQSQPSVTSPDAHYRPTTR